MGKRAKKKTAAAAAAATSSAENCADLLRDLPDEVLLNVMKHLGFPQRQAALSGQIELFCVQYFTDSGKTPAELKWSC